MSFQLKRVYDEPQPEDGRRVLVDRLWPRGVKKENAAVDVWMKDVTPSNELRKWIHADPSEARWQEFRDRYFAELDAVVDVGADAVAELRGLSAKGRVTLLYAARDTARNHAMILREYLERTA